ncbi:MAG: hypothetical protein ABEK59_04885 [Halobacteria archaeon]
MTEDMQGYSVDVRDLHRENPSEYHRITRRIADAAARERDVAAIRLKALYGKVEDVEGFSSLGIDPCGWIDREIEVDDGEAELVSRMFSDALTKVIYKGEEGSPVFARYPDGQVYVDIQEEALKETGVDGDRVRDVSEEVSGAGETEMTQGVLKALMEETPEDDEA